MTLSGEGHNEIPFPAHRRSRKLNARGNTRLVVSWKTWVLRVMVQSALPISTLGHLNNSSKMPTCYFEHYFQSGCNLLGEGMCAAVRGLHAWGSPELDADRDFLSVFLHLTHVWREIILPLGVRLYQALPHWYHKLVQDQAQEPCFQTMA